jgi:hypothetical protein
VIFSNRIMIYGPKSDGTTSFSDWARHATGMIPLIKAR